MRGGPGSILMPVSPGSKGWQDTLKNGVSRPMEMFWVRASPETFGPGAWARGFWNFGDLGKPCRGPGRYETAGRFSGRN